MDKKITALEAATQPQKIAPAPHLLDISLPPAQKELPKPADVIPIERGLMRKAIEGKKVQEHGVIPFPSQIEEPLEAKDVLPEKTKPLRMELRTDYHGTLKYSGEMLDNGNVEFMLKVRLSHDPEEKFSMELTPKDLESADSLYKMLLEKVVSYVFKYEDVKPAEEQYGLKEGDRIRIKEMAQDIIETFTGKEAVSAYSGA